MGVAAAISSVTESQIEMFARDWQNRLEQVDRDEDDDGAAIELRAVETALAYCIPQTAGEALILLERLVERAGLCADDAVAHALVASLCTGLSRMA